MTNRLAISVVVSSVVLALLNLVALQKINSVEARTRKENLKTTLLTLYATKASESTVKSVLGDPRVTARGQERVLLYSQEVEFGDVWTIRIRIDEHGKVFSVLTENISLGERE